MRIFVLQYRNTFNHVCVFVKHYVHCLNIAALLERRQGCLHFKQVNQRILNRPHEAAMLIEIEMDPEWMKEC
jgi:hypothetical protein